MKNKYLKKTNAKNAAFKIEKKRFEKKQQQHLSMSTSIENFDFEEEPSSVSSTSNPSAKDECLKKIIEQHFDEEIAYKQLELNTIDEVTKKNLL